MLSHDVTIPIRPHALDGLVLKNQSPRRKLNKAVQYFLEGVVYLQFASGTGFEPQLLQRGEGGNSGRSAVFRGSTRLVGIHDGANAC